MSLDVGNFQAKRGLSLVSAMLISCGIMILIPQVLFAEQIRGAESMKFFDRATRFFEMRDHSVRVVALGSILIGLSCGMIGSYVVTRRLSLFGDTLSHAVLPGIAMGFLWAESKNNLALLTRGILCRFFGSGLHILFAKVH
jgi:manganese/zinc/iron transport system permease protein